MSVINFTAHFDVLGSQSDWVDVGVDADVVPLVGEVQFTPLLADDALALAPTYSPRAAGLKFRTSTGYIDSDGRLKTISGGTVGVRLWANDPIFGFDDPLVYRVRFNLRTPAGSRVKIDDRFFEAPAYDTTVQLADVMQPTVPLAVRALPITAGTFSGNSVIFENGDGTFVDPITIPEGFQVWVDNGDSTWSVGEG